MKEVKFRAWKHTYTPSGSSDIGEMIYAIKLGNNIWNSEDIEINKILKEIPRLMQYTGLLDKNSVEIYEHDIVSIDGDAVKNYEVEYVMCCYGISTNNGFVILSDIATSIADGTNAKCKVIGNIYENSELLEH